MFYARSIQVDFVVDKAAVVRVFLQRVFWLFCVSAFPTITHTFTLFNY